VGRRPSSFVECLLISHFLIAVAFLFVIIQWTARFNEQIRSCTRRLAYLPAAIPDFDFLINTDLRALRVLLQEGEEAMGSSRNLTLYVDLLSQPCRAVTIFCRVNEIEADVQIVSLWKKETREPPFLAINPLGKVPAIDDGGFTLSESHTIMRYLAATRTVADHWYPEDLEKRACVDRVLDWQFGNLHCDVGK
jgi:hypothetical protein